MYNTMEIKSTPSLHAELSISSSGHFPVTPFQAKREYSVKFIIVFIIT